MQKQKYMFKNLIIQKIIAIFEKKIINVTKK